MFGIILNTIATLFVILSLIYMGKAYKRELDIYEEILRIENNIKDYSVATKKLLDDFDKLLDESLDKLDSIDVGGNAARLNSQGKENNTKNPSVNNEPKDEKDKIWVYKGEDSKEASSFNYSEILELKKIGLANEEIAKKLDIGIREVEVFLRISNIR